MKTDRTLYSKHFILLSILFILGNTCIIAPVKNANKYNFFSFLICCFIGTVLAFIFYYIPINKLTVMPVVLLGFYCIGDTFITFIRFINNNLLQSTPKFFIALPFLLILVYISFKKSDTLYKFSLISGVLTLAVILLFFFSTITDFNIKNIIIYKLPDFDNFLVQSSFYFKTVVLPLAILGVFAKGESIKKGDFIVGICGGFIFLAVIILNSVLLFGIEFSAFLKYPYSSAGSTVTFGNLFTRLDGFLYFVYSATAIVKCAVGIFTIKKSVSCLRCRFILLI